MKKIKKNNTKKLIAVMLTLIMVLSSIPFNQWVLKKAYAENKTSESSIIILTDDNNDVISWAKVVLSYEKGNLAVAEEKTLIYDKEKKGYKLTDDDYAILKDETLSNIKVNIEAEGFEKIVDETSLITTVSNEKKSVVLTPNFSMTSFQIELVGDDSQYIYTGSSIQLIKSITGLSKANLTQPQGEPDNLSYITTTYEYNVEYSLDNKIYQNDVPTGIDAGIYDVYVKVSQKASKYTHTSAEFNKETAVFDSDETQYIIKHKDITIKKAQLTDEQFQFDLTNVIGTGTQENPILVEWNKATVTYPASKTISDGEITYRVEDSLNHCSINANNGELSFNENCIDTIYPVYAAITGMQNYEDKEICYYIKVVKQNLDAIQFSDIIKENGEYKKTITYENGLNTSSLLIYGDSKKEVPNVKYSIKSQKPLDGDKALENGEDVAVIDETTGELSINRSGIVVVTAAIDEHLYQGEDGNTYDFTLTILKKEHNIHFENVSSPVQAQYGDVLKHQAKFIDEDDADDRKIDTIKYEISDKNTIKDIDSTIDKNGTVTINSVCDDSEQTFIVVTATLDANDKYAKATATYTIKSSAGEQSFILDDTPANIYFGQFGQSFFIRSASEIQSGSGNSIVYALKEINSIVKPVENGYVSINNKGEISLDYNKITKTTPDFEVQVTASLSGCPNGSSMQLYKTIEKNYILKYNKAPDNTGKKYYSEKGNNNGLQAEELWYREDVTLIAMDKYKLAKSLSNKDNWEYDFKDSITIDASTNETQIYYRNTDTGIISIGPKISLKIDKTVPKDLEVNYIANTIFNKMSDFDYRFGASGKKTNLDDGQKYVQVTLSASDSGTDKSGIYKFKYWGESFESVNGNLKSFETEAVLKADSSWKVDGDKVSYTFTVPEEFKGKINFIAYDKAGNEMMKYEKLEDNKIIIISDDTAPKITPSIDKTKMELIIDDDAFDNSNDEITRFYQNNIDIDVTYIPFHGTENKEKNRQISEDIKKNIQWNETVKNIGTYEFKDNGEYTIKVSSKDPAGNIGESETKSFQIDTTAPAITTEMNVADSQDNLKSGEIVKNPVKLTVAVTENGVFDSTKINISITGTDINGKDILKDSTDAIIKKFQENSGWTSVEDKDKNTCTYTKSILFEQDARYNWTIQYTDAAGNVSGEPIKENVIIDRKPPNEYAITYSEEPKNILEYIDKFFKILFFGEEKIDVTIKAEDSISGIKQLQYSTGDGNFTDLPLQANENQANIFTATFPVNAEYRNKLYIKGVDKAGNSSSFDGDEVILDIEKPELQGSFQSNGIQINDGSTYNTNIQAYITVIENNFFEDDLQYTVNYTPFLNGKLDEAHKEDMKVLINWNGQTAACEFTKEGQYDVEFRYKDKSGNEAEKIKKMFYIDKTALETESKLVGDYENANHYRTNVGYQLFIKENYFNPDGLKIDVQYISYDGEELNISQTVKDSLIKTWHWDDQIWNVLEYSFEQEGYYKVSYSYTNRSGQCSKENISTFYIDKTAPIIGLECKNSPNASEIDDYTQNVTTAYITVTEVAEFDPKDFKIEVTAKDVTGEPAKDINVKDYAEKLNNPKNWNSYKGIHKAEIVFNKEYQYEIKLNFTDKAGCSAIEVIRTFVYDKSKPTDLTIEYSPNLPTTTLTHKQIVDYYFGKDTSKVTVTISANDSTSGIKNFIYTTDNVEYITVEVEEKDFTESNRKNARISFDVSADYKGSIWFSVTDKAGNTETVVNNEVIVLDKTPPVVTVTYVSDEKPVIENNYEYYQNIRKAKIEIKETNFNPEGVNLSILRSRLQGGSSDMVEVTPEYAPDYNQFDDNNQPKGWILENGNYVKYVNFDENADYIFNLTVTDYAGNQYTMQEQKFTVDTINPTIHVSYGKDEVQPLNSNWFKQARTATVTVVEHNFDATRVDVTVTAKDMAGNVADAVNVDKEYADYVKNAENWTYKGNDTYTIVLNYKEDAHYTFDISMTDLAGRKNVNEKNELYVDYQDSIAPNIFVIDKSIPVVMPTYTSDATVVNENHYNQNINLQFTVSENNFYKEDAKVEVVYTPYNGAVNENYGENVTKALEWENPTSSDTWTAKARYIFTDEGKYTVTISYTDKAGNVCKIAPKEFYIDKTVPKIKFEYLDEGSADSVNTKYYKQARTAQITITENDFNPKNIRLHILRRLNSEQTYTDVAGIYAVKYDVLDGWAKDENDENSFVKEIEFNEDADYEVSLSFTDDAGNQADIETQTFTVDLTNPQVNVTFSNMDVRNENQFRNSRTATITIIEHNFQPERVNVLITAVDANGHPVYNENELAIQDEFKTYLTKADSWEHTGDIHTAHILFEKDANYTFDINITDMAGHNNIDALGKNVVAYTGIACNQFTIDTTLPTGSIQIADWTQSKDGTLWNKFLTNITFGLWLQTDAAVVINSDDSLSGIEYVRYYTVDRPLTEEAVKALPDSAWLEGTSFKMGVDARFIVYARIMDNAGNEILISSDGIILDNTKPAGDATEPRITIRTEDKNNIYNQDVRLDIYVEDPAVGSLGVYSGIQKITCTVTNRAIDMVTQDVLLYEFGNDNPKQEELIHEWSLAESFVVDQNMNNSNDIIVAVTAIDNAGNSSTKYLPLAIDETAPRIEIYYDNDDGDSSFEETTYFKTERTATIDIIERNFNADDVNINVTSTDDILPDISDWTIVGGTASNGDDTIHRATIHYYADGDYTFDISYADMAGNVADNIEYSGLAPQQFTIDSILPVISVAYDNNDAINGNYYNQARTATVTIEEHNFETSRIVAEITTEGGTANVPQLSDWSSAGDTHTATISYTGDTLYGFALQYTDMAGNQAMAYERDNFYIDMTMPELSIQRIENESANKEELIAPVIAFSDQYYDRIDILLNGEKTDTMGFYDMNENGGIFTFNNITKDDIYTLSASVFDRAGNVTEQQIVFSVNRNGSTYDLEASTEKINGSYIKETKDIIVYEINPDPLLTHKVTLYKNGKTILLTEGIDYSVNIDGGSGSWYKYIYNIFAKNFDDDGIYRLSVQSTDKAGNIAENTIDTKNREISFGVDNTMPNIMLLNLESGKTYAANSLNVLMSISDNLKLSSVLAYVDDVLVREWTSDEIMSLINAGEDFAFDIAGTSTNAHYVRIVAVDAAGNSQEIEARDFYVTTNIWIRFYTNTVLFWGSIGIALLFIAGITGIVFIKKRKKKQQR